MTYPVHKGLMAEEFGYNTNSGEKIKHQLSVLEMQNAKYLQNMARLENEMAMRSGKENNKKPMDSEKYQMMQKMREMENQNMKLVENNEFLSEKLNQLEFEYDQMKSYLDQNLEKCEELFMKVQDNDESKENIARRARKLEDSLKSLNQNYILLQRKTKGLETENKELTLALRNSEAEKRNISEKWQKLSKKARQDSDYLQTTKTYEAEIMRCQKEVQECKEKYLLKDAQVRTLKEDEKNFKALLESTLITMQDLEAQQAAETKEKEVLVMQNYELNQKFSELQAKFNSFRNTPLLNKQQQESVTMETQGSEKKENKLLEENEELKKSQEKLKEEVDYVHKKWEILIKEYNRLENAHKKLQAESQEEQAFQEALKSLHSGGGGMNSSESEREIMISNPMIMILKSEINKVKVYDEELWTNIQKCLNMCLQSLGGESDEPSESQAKYNKLMVKYYKLYEKVKNLEKGGSVRETYKASPHESQPENKSHFLSTSGSAGTRHSIHIPRLSISIPEVNNNSAVMNNSAVVNSSNFTPMEIQQQAVANFNKTLSLKGISKVEGGSGSSGKLHFQPLQRILMNNTMAAGNNSNTNKGQKSMQARRLSKDWYKENMTPNNMSRETENQQNQSLNNGKRKSISKENLNVMNISGGNITKKPIDNNRILRSLSIENTLKNEKKASKSYLNTTMDLNNSRGNLENTSSSNLSVKDVVKLGESIKRKSLGEGREGVNKNRSYLDLYLSKKVPPGLNTSATLNNNNDSFTFPSNI